MAIAFLKFGLNFELRTVSTYILTALFTSQDCVLGRDALVKGFFESILIYWLLFQCNAHLIAINPCHMCIKIEAEGRGLETFCCYYFEASFIFVQHDHAHDISFMIEIFESLTFMTLSSSKPITTSIFHLVIIWPLRTALWWPLLDPLYVFWYQLCVRPFFPMTIFSSLTSSHGCLHYLWPL